MGWALCSFTPTPCVHLVVLALNGVLLVFGLTSFCSSCFPNKIGCTVHEHDIIHRDIKPDNLLRSEDGTLKIVDFGVSEMFKKGNDRTKTSAGSPAFMAPELCRHDHGEVSGRATDVWSMGVTLFCIRYGRLPFVSNNILELNRVIREDDFDLSTEKDDRFITLMRRLLEKDPVQRISVEELRVRLLTTLTLFPTRVQRHSLTLYSYPL